MLVLAVVVGGGILSYFNSLKEETTLSTEFPEIEQPETKIPEEHSWTLDDLIKEYTEIEFLKYTDNEFGFSFYYPKSWQLSREEGDIIKLENPDPIEIIKYSGQRVEDSDAKFGRVAYYYDENTKQWMGDYNTDFYAGIELVEPIFYTIPGYSPVGFPVFEGVGRWKTNIVGLSNEKFLIINISGSGFTVELDPFTKTITSPRRKVYDDEIRKPFIEGIRTYKEETE